MISIYEIMKKLYRERVGVYIFKDDKLVVGKIKTSSWSGYIVPGGGVDPRESLEDAAIREVKEELGISIKNLKLLSKNIKIKYSEINKFNKKYEHYSGYNNSFFVAEYNNEDKSIFNSEGDGFDIKEVTISELINFFKQHAKNCDNKNDTFNRDTALQHINNLKKIHKG